jgi:acetyltransferase-like isoleucine patch superfamily enzyme
VLSLGVRFFNEREYIGDYTVLRKAWQGVPAMGRNNDLIDSGASIASTARVLGKVKIDRDALIHDFVTIYPNVRIESNVEIFEGAIIGKPPTVTRAVARQVSSDLGTTTIGHGCVISPHAVIYTDVQIGDETLVGDNASIRERCIIGKQCIIGRNVTIHYNTTIGDSSKIMDLTNITGNMIIGSHVFISTLVATTNDSNFGLKGYEESHIRGPVIEDYAMVGAGANILPGIRVGVGAMVGAGAVVTKDVPSKKLVIGIPARIVKDLEF